MISVNRNEHHEEAATSFTTLASSGLCVQDAIPTWIIKQCKDELLTTITETVNVSLTYGKFPKEMKKALAKPLIKETSLD